jgi:hypothetical protein
MKEFKCIYCGKTYSTAGNLKSHQAKTKKCLVIQNKKPDPEYKCNYCDKEFLRMHHYQNHLTKHIINKDVERDENTKERIKILETENKDSQNVVDNLKEENERLRRELKEALDRERETLLKLVFLKTLEENEENEENEEQKPSNVVQCLKTVQIDPKITIDQDNLLQTTSEMIEAGEVNVTTEFASTFMFALSSEEKFPINVELLVDRRVFSAKRNAKRVLLRYFTQDVDYVINEDFQQGTISEDREIIMLNAECFKSLCQTANNDIGRQTRLYYQDMEKILKKYILTEYNDRINYQNSELKRISRNHNAILKKRTYFQFKTGPCMYILSFSGKHKIGFSDDMNKVLPGERRMVPTLRVEFLVYSPEAYRLEQNMLLKHKMDLETPNHEIVLKLDTETLINSTRKIIDMLNLEYQEEDQLSEYNDLI